MRSLKYLILCVVGVCLGLTSFSGAVSSCTSTGSVESLIDNIIIFSGEKSGNVNSRYELFDYGNYGEGTYCLKFTTSGTARDLQMGFSTSNGTPSNTYTMYSNQYGNWICLYGNKSSFKYAIKNFTTTFNYEVYRLSDLYSQSYCSEYSCESSNTPSCGVGESCYNDSVISTMSGNYNQCLNSLNVCNADLTNCTNGNDTLYLQCVNDKDACFSSLNSLSGQYLSCVNMNSSLTDQLQECLQSGTGDMSELLCNTYDLNWYDGNDMFSINISNNLWLPRGYKGYLSEGVLGIKPIYSPDNAYSIDDSDFQKVVNSYGLIFIYMFSGALFLMFLFFIRKFFIGLKS